MCNYENCMQRTRKSQDLKDNYKLIFSYSGIAIEILKRIAMLQIYVRNMLNVYMTVIFKKLILILSTFKSSIF